VTRVPVFLDCDTGVDDSLALGYLALSPAVDLVGVSTVSGNIDAASAARNTLDLLALAGRPEVPVAVGCHDFLSHPFGGGVPHIHVVTASETSTCRTPPHARRGSTGPSC